jgi:hypothetical protein
MSTPKRIKPPAGLMFFLQGPGGVILPRLMEALRLMIAD